MRTTWFIAVACLASAVACTERSASAPNATAKHGVELRLSPTIDVAVARTSAYAPSAKEQELLHRLDAVTSPQLAAGLKKALSSPSTVVSVRDNPAAQSIVDSILTLHQQAARAAMATATATVAGPSESVVNSSIAIALVDHLQDPAATAVILRRPNRLPHDVILLRRADATAAELGAAMTTLAEVHERDGPVPFQSRVIVTHARAMPRRWHADGSEAAANQTLAALRAAPEEDIVGIGHAQAVSLTMGRRTRTK